MKIKIKLQTEDPYDFELDILESFCTIPILIDDKITMGLFVAGIDLTESTYEEIPKELKKILDEKDTKSFYVKKSVLTITGLTAYNISIGKDINISKIFENFSKYIKVYELISTYSYPYEGMIMYFQTKGEISIEFDLEDVLFIEAKNWYDVQEEEISKIQDINNSNHREFLERVHLDQVTFKINLEESSYYKK